MTPLAHQVLKQMVLPSKRQAFVDNCNILPLMDDVRYFDCRDVSEIASDLTFDPKFEQLKETTAFLPAAKTWIEVKRFGVELGVLLISSTDGVSARFVVKGNSAGGYTPWFGEFSSRPSVVRFTLTKDGLFDLSERIDLPAGSDDAIGIPIFLLTVAGCLALINSPRTIGRTTNRPHAGLQRDLANKFKGKGEFRLHPWTKILLRVSPHSADQPVSEPHICLSGAKARHFVRKFLRIRLGRLETVSDHWRGDAALGIKQSTYRVVPGSKAEPK